MTEKEIRTAIKMMLEEAKEDVIGYCEFAAASKRSAGKAIAQSCYEFLARRIDEITVTTGEEDSDDLPF